MANYKFIGKSALIDGKILVIADLHLGYEENLASQGVFFPKTQYKTIIEDLNRIFEEISKNKNDFDKNKVGGLGFNAGKNKIGNNNKIILGGGNIDNNYQINNAEKLVFNDNNKLDKIIILGDLKHEFSENSSQEWKEVLKLLNYLKTKTEKIILVKGNHDNYLNTIANKLGIELVDFYLEGEYGFVHGNKKIIVKEELKHYDSKISTKNNKNQLNNGELAKACCFSFNNKNAKDLLSNKNIKTIFLGHLHPSISIRENAKEEKYKCFLVGKYKNKEVIILPSFFPLIEGLDVNRENIENSNLAYNFNLKNFNVFIPIENQVLDFGKVNKIGRLN